LDETERKNNLKKAFKTQENKVQLSHILLVDDIYTTGSTINEAALELKMGRYRTGILCQRLYRERILGGRDMEVKNCKGCGRLFNYLQGPPLCPACTADLENKFQQVKDYLRENPKAQLNQIAEDNDVSVKQIRQWVREERLTFTEESQITLDCENCGAPILTGRFCDRCRANFEE